MILIKLFKILNLLHLEDLFAKSLDILQKSTITTRKMDALIQYSEFLGQKIHKKDFKIKHKGLLQYISTDSQIVVQESFVMKKNLWAYNQLIKGLTCGLIILEAIDFQEIINGQTSIHVQKKILINIIRFRSLKWLSSISPHYGSTS